MSRRLKAKRGEKWWTFGNVTEGKKGTLKIGLKKSKELTELMAQEGEWVNFIVVDEDKKEPLPPSNPTEPVDIDDNIPF